MLEKGMTGQRLRFSSPLEPDESIPGAIAKRVREHVLVATRPVFEAANVPLRHVGLAQLASADELGRLAYVIRCDPQQLIDRAGCRVEETSGKSNVRATFGPLTILRTSLELNRRRIGPKSLGRADYHRLHWLNLQLPHCAESLERLVDSCPLCKAPLAWRFARGLGYCETCSELVPPSPAPGLAEELGEGYRFFARLSSPHARSVEQARTKLPQALQAIRPDSLVEFALRIGSLSVDLDRTPARTSTLTMAPDEIAKSAAVGAEMLRSYPASLQNWVREADRELDEDVSGIAELRKRLRSIGGETRPELQELVEHALPNLRRYASHGLVTTKRYYLYTETRRRLRFDHEQMGALKIHPEVLARHLSPSAKRQLTQYDADHIDALVLLLENAVPARSLRKTLGLPLYAIEQLHLDGILEVEDHFIVGIASNKLHIRQASVDWMMANLWAGAIRRAPPNGSVKLGAAANGIGGGLKPWGTIVGAMLNGAFPFWMSSPKDKIPDLSVRPHDILPLRRAPIELRKSPFGLDQEFCQADAAEVLNIQAGDLARHSDLLGLRSAGPRPSIPRSDVLRAAGEIAWPGEISLHLRVSPQKVRFLLQTTQVREILTGWDRRQLQDAGLLPT